MDLIGRLRGPAAHDREATTTVELAVPGALLAYSTTRALPRHTLYGAAVCIVLQGRKRVTLADARLECGPGECFVVGLDLPVVAEVLEASRECPYLALVLPLDPALLRELSSHLPPGSHTATPSPARQLRVGVAGAGAMAAVERLLALEEDADAAAALGGSALRELYYRLLRGPAGPALLAAIERGTAGWQVAEAVAHIRANLSEPLRIDELARRAGMSETSFRLHFRRATDFSPLQYIKRLRLLEARRRMRRGGTARLQEVAYGVGYESASQFSREFKRAFGHAPREEIRAVG